MSLEEVLLIKNTDQLREHYVTAFEEKFGHVPYIEREYDEIFKWACRMYSLEKAKSLLIHFLDMRDEWFISQAFSPQCFRKNINKVLASYGSLTRRESGSKGMVLNVRISCDKCFKHFDYIVPTKVLLDDTKPRLCPDCQSEL